MRRFAEPGARLGAGRPRPRRAGGARRARSRAPAARRSSCPTDVADADAVEAAATATEEALGPIDIWINDAMTTVFAFFEDVEPDEFRRATDVTYHGIVWGMQAALKRMLPRDRGTIVQVGSAMAYRGIPLQAPYCGAKHAHPGRLRVAAHRAAPQGLAAST